MKEHELKTLSCFFKSIDDGKKKAEIRKNDRGFSVGDILILKEYEPCESSIISGTGTAIFHKRIPPHYTGKYITVKVTHILFGENFRENYGIKDGYAMLSFEILDRKT